MEYNAFLCMYVMIYVFNPEKKYNEVICIQQILWKTICENILRENKFLCISYKFIFIYT